MKWYIKDTQKRLAVAKEESEELKAKLGLIPLP
jgi:hypothetical protein